MASTEGEFPRASGQPEDLYRPEETAADDHRRSQRESMGEGDDGAFGRVLREMASHLGAADSVAPEELQRLIGIARRRAGQTVDADVASVELVAEILSHRLGHVVSGESVWRALTEAVAGTLQDDPPSRERLARLWSRLQEHLS
jgi:hypothetical protein